MSYDDLAHTMCVIFMLYIIIVNSRKHLTSDKSIQSAGDVTNRWKLRD